MSDEREAPPKPEPENQQHIAYGTELPDPKKVIDSEGVPRKSQ